MLRSRTVRRRCGTSIRDNQSSAYYKQEWQVSKTKPNSPAFSIPEKKLASFEYARPADLDQACAMLATGDDMRIIPSGQSVVALIAMRLARPKRLIDIARISDLSREPDAISVGATPAANARRSSARRCPCWPRSYRLSSCGDPFAPNHWQLIKPSSDLHASAELSSAHLHRADYAGEAPL
jgi:FAD binding domain in molybdopterin dehydrogenase